MVEAHTIARIRAHHTMARLLGRRVRTGRIPRQQQPLAIEADYATRLIAILDRMRPAIDRLVRELPDLLGATRGDGMRTDAGESRRASFLVDQVRQAAEESTDPAELEQLARRYAAATTAFQRAQLARQVIAALGVDILDEHALSSRMTTMIDHFIGENVALIRAVPAAIVADIDKMVARGFAGGQHADTVTANLRDRLDIGERHVRLIARDQIGKLTGQANVARQQDLGIRQFRWRSVGDDRVRPRHAELDGQTFAYDDPPDEGLPGEPPLCRCEAEPVFDSILEAAQAM